MPKGNFKFFNPTNLFNSIHVLDIGYHDHSIVPNYSNKPRTYYHYLFHYVLDGKGTLIYNNTTYKLQKHSAFFCPPFHSSFYYPDKNEPYKFIWIGIEGDELEKYLTSKGLDNNNVVFKCKNPEEVYKMFVDYLFDKKQSEITEASLLWIIFKFLDSIKPLPVQPCISSIIKDVCNFIESNYTQSALTIKDIANYVHISHSWLCYIFKKNMGISMKEYLLDARLTKAKLLLSTTNMPIQNISECCGFNDSHYFSAIFKKKFKHSPLFHRQKNSQKPIQK